MDVTAQDQRVAHAAAGHRVEQSLARGGVAGPAVVPVQRARPWILVDQREHHPLGHEIPTRLWSAQACIQPALLYGSEQRAPRIVPLEALVGVDPGAAFARRLRTGLWRAVLTGVEHVQRRERSQRDARVERGVGTARLGRARQRHVFPVGPIRGPPPRGEIVLFARVLRLQAGVVVVDLVVVPGDEPRAGRVRGAQMRIAAVPGVAQAVLVERHALAGVMLAHRIPRAALVDVVAEVQHEVDAARHHVAPGVVEALLVMLAARRADAQPVRHVAGRCGGPGTPDGAQRVAGAEPIEIRAAGSQSRDLEMDGVGFVGEGDRAAASQASRERLVLGDLPAQFEVVETCAAVG